MTNDNKVDTGLSSPSHVAEGHPYLQLSMKVRTSQKCSSSVQSTPDIEKKYVHHVYDAIAPHFSSTRFAKWPKVSTFLNSLPRGSLVLDAGCGNGKYLGLNPNCFYIGCDISPSLVNICAERAHEVVVADAVILPYRPGFGDAAISIAVLHHLSTENRRRKAIQELIRVVKKGGLVLITVWAAEQEDRSLLTKWTPLTQKLEEWVGPGSPRIRSPSTLTLQSIPETEENTFGNKMKAIAQQPLAHKIEEWVGPGSPRVRSPSNLTLQSIPETDDNSFGKRLKDMVRQSKEKMGMGGHSTSEIGDISVVSGDRADTENQQEYFVPWHLPYHRAEISGHSACALASGLAKKDDKKGSVVYNRYYHVFMEGELERLVSGIENAAIVDRFYDKSNWCIILEKL